jgi:AraC-like DNA-binding protein
MRVARLRALQDDLTSDPSLDLASLAARHAISPRYVQKLFDEAGTTYSDFVLELRLDLARRMLSSPRYEASTVTSVAFDSGFGDLSSFNRRFKQRYGMTPSEYRYETRVRN